MTKHAQYCLRLSFWPWDPRTARRRFPLSTKIRLKLASHRLKLVALARSNLLMVPVIQRADILNRRRLDQRIPTVRIRCPGLLNPKHRPPQSPPALSHFLAIGPIQEKQLRRRLNYRAH